MFRSRMNRARRKGASQIVRLALRSAAYPWAPSPPVPAGSRASPLSTYLRNDARPPSAENGLLHRGLTPDAKALVELTTPAPREPARHHQWERPDAPCISPAFEGIGPRINGNRSGAGEGVGDQLLHPHADDCAGLAYVEMPPDDRVARRSALSSHPGPGHAAHNPPDGQRPRTRYRQTVPRSASHEGIQHTRTGHHTPKTGGEAEHFIEFLLWPVIPVPVFPSKGRGPAKRV